MFLFREKETEKLKEFLKSKTKKAMAIYGRRRTGKTELILNFLHNAGKNKCVYFQCTSYDYNSCLSDFISTLQAYYPTESLITSFTSFRDIFIYISKLPKSVPIIIIDEFPFLAKKNENTVVEFQWIIDHALGKNKLILLGSNRSFMRNQLSNQVAPLYGRFDEILEVLPFTFDEVHTIYKNFDEAMNVYAVTGGVAQYVMFFQDYNNCEDAINNLFFDKNGRLFQEASNMLLQELKDSTTYVSILRSIGANNKTSCQIAHKCNIDQRAVFTYLNKLIELGIIETEENFLATKKQEKRFKISDLLFRYNYTFIEPNSSIITALGKDSKKFVLGNRYSEYMGFVYEDLIKANCYKYASKGIIPFMPIKVGKWWGNILMEGEWQESEVDLIAFNSEQIIIGECKFKNKAIGLKELESLKAKATSIPTRGKKVIYLLASKAGFTIDLKRLSDDIILIKGI